MTPKTAAVSFTRAISKDSTDYGLDATYSVDEGSVPSVVLGESDSYPSVVVVARRRSSPYSAEKETRSAFHYRTFSH